MLEAEVRRISTEFGSPSPRRLPLGPLSPLGKTTTPTTPAHPPAHPSVSAPADANACGPAGDGGPANTRSEGGRGGFIHMLFGSDL